MMINFNEDATACQQRQASCQVACKKIIVDLHVDPQLHGLLGDIPATTDSPKVSDEFCMTVWADKAPAVVFQELN